MIIFKLFDSQNVSYFHKLKTDHTFASSHPLAHGGACNVIFSFCSVICHEHNVILNFLLLLSFTVPSGVIIGLSLVIRSMLSDIHVCDVATVWRLRSSTPSLPTHFPWITHFTSSHPPSLIVCPKNESLRRTTNPSCCMFVLS